MDDKTFVKTVKDSIDNLMEQDKYYYAAKWDTFKQEVKIIAMERGSANQNSARKQEEFLRSTLKILIGKESRTPGVFKGNICTVKAQLEILDK